MAAIGYLNLGSPESDGSNIAGREINLNAFRLTGLRRGLNQSGYVEGRNLVHNSATQETAALQDVDPAYVADWSWRSCIGG
jgi:hypothetical protein